MYERAMYTYLFLGYIYNTLEETETRDKNCWLNMWKQIFWKEGSIQHISPQEKKLQICVNCTEVANEVVYWQE